MRINLDKYGYVKRQNITKLPIRTITLRPIRTGLLPLALYILSLLYHQRRFLHSRWLHCHNLGLQLKMMNHLADRTKDDHQYRALYEKKYFMKYQRVYKYGTKYANS